MPVGRPPTAHRVFAPIRFILTGMTVRMNSTAVYVKMKLCRHPSGIIAASVRSSGGNGADNYFSTRAWNCWARRVYGKPR